MRAILLLSLALSVPSVCSSSEGLLSEAYSAASSKAAKAGRSAMAWKGSGGLCAEVDGILQDGDLVFLDVKDKVQFLKLYKAVARASNSWTSHVGVLFRDGSGNAVVYESRLTTLGVAGIGPSGSATPLCEYLARADGDRFAVGRLRAPLTPAALERVKAFAQDRRNLGMGYEKGFDFDRQGKTFCSKFAHQAYLAGGVSLGRMQTFGDLESEFLGTEGERRAVLSTLETWMLRPISSIRGRRTMTPASILEDPKLDVFLKNGVR